MKLVDILARDLKDWPKGVEAIEQSSTSLTIFEAGKFSLQHKKYCVGELADDRENAIVTRAQWQAAVDALKAGEQAWDGTDLPPVGCVCEHSNLIKGEPWTKVEVVAHRTFEGDDYPCAIFVYRKGSSHSSSGEHFRPIRTAEQIAAEERKNAIDEMVQFFMNYYGNPKGAEQYFLICRSLHDAGYRKQVQP